MLISKHNRIFIELVSFACLTLGADLSASTSVTSSAGDSSSGTLSSAIDEVNSGTSTSPIQINSGVTPTLTTVPFSTVTTSMKIGSNVSGSLRTINGNNVTYGMNIASNLSLYDIILENTNVRVLGTNSSVYARADSWDSGSSLTLQNGTFIAAGAGEETVFIRNIYLDQSGKISTDYSGSVIITGQISEIISNSTLEIDGFVGLNNTTSSNSWTGGTSVNEASLAINSSSSFPSSGNTSLTDGVLAFYLENSDTYTGSGNITGPGLLKINSGTVNLSGDVTDCEISVYGGTANFSGTVSVSDIADIDTRITFFGGTTTLSGDNSANPIDLWIDGFNFNEFPELILASPIHPGSYIRFNQGTLNVQTDITLTPGLYASAMSYPSTITTSSGSTLTLPSLQVQVLNTGGALALTINGAGTTCIEKFILYPYGATNTFLTVEGPLGGSSDLTLSGTGIMALTSVNTYTGATFVGDLSSDVVTLRIDSEAQIGSLNEPITINSNCTLTDNGAIFVSTLTNNGSLNGTGTINGDSVENYGTISGGNSPGTLILDADFVSFPGSIVSVSVAPTQASLLDVLGTITLDSDVTLQIQPELGCYGKNENFVILETSDEIIGTFSNIQIGSLLLLPTVTYVPDGVVLNIIRGNLANIGLRGNAQAVAQAVDTLIDEGHSLCGVMGDFILSSKKEISDALNLLQPSLLKGLTISQENNAVKVQDSLSYRMQIELDSVHCFSVNSNKEELSDCNQEKRPFQVWINGMGDALHQSKSHSKQNSYVGYHESMGGVVLGVDSRFANCLYAGILGAYTDSDIKWNEELGKGHIQSAYTGLYFSALGKMFYGNVSVIGAWNHYNAHRNIDLPSDYLTAKNKHGGAQLLSHADTGVNLGWKGLTVRPFDSFDYITQTENAFTEVGAGDLDLSVEKNNAIMLRNELGLNFSYCLCFKETKWMISPKISWVREVRIKGAETTASFEDTDTFFTVTGFFPNRNLVSPGVSLTGTAWGERLTVGLYYDGEINGNYSDHSYGGQVRVGF